jgi:hypothetical protein
MISIDRASIRVTVITSVASVWKAGLKVEKVYPPRPARGVSSRSKPFARRSSRGIAGRCSACGP